MINTTISHYKILEKLGEGGMGVVYKAHDDKLHRDVALKFLPSYLSSDATERERFLYEARAAATLNHPNIATVYEIDEHDGPDGATRLFLAMEIIEGGTLRNLLSKELLSIDKVLETGIQVSEGLSAAHEKGIIHRDIKPENIMVTAKGLAKIMDFGLARVGGVTKLTKAGSTLGTIGYMSPEQIRGEEVDRRSDIFSLGVVLFELLAGTKPFRGEHEASISYSILNEEPMPIARFNNKVTPELERIVRKALSKDRQERYQHADDLLADLRHERKGLDYAKSGYVKATATEQTTGAKADVPKNYVSGMKYFVGLVVLVGIALVVFKLNLPFGEGTVKSGSAERKSIAVLPLANLSGNQEDEFFSDGITEDIITQLSKIGELKVISRTSTMQYKNSKKNLKEIGKELGVATILEGSVRRAGDQIRIVTQLIDANTDEHLWAETYDREFKQIFSIQSEIAQKIAAQLKATFTPRVKEQIEKKPTENLEAYTYFLKAREYYGVRNNEQAIVHLKKAIELDPNYAAAYAWLGQSYAQRAVRFGYPAVWLDSALSMAQKAISFDQDMVEGNTTLARVYLSRGEVMKGLETAEKAIEMKQVFSARTYAQLGMGSFFLGRLHDAIRSHDKASSLEPTGPILALLGQIYLASEMYRKSEAVLQQALELQATSPDALYGLGLLRLIEGRVEESMALSQKAYEASPDYVNMLHLRAMIQLFRGDYAGAEKRYRQLAVKGVYVPASFPLGVVSTDYEAALGLIALKAGKKAEAKQFFDRSLQMNRKAIDSGNELYHYRYNIAAVQAVQGNKEEALRWLQQAVNAGWRLYRIAQIDPFFESLRSEGEFQQLMSKVKVMVDEERRKVEEWEKNDASN